MKRKRGVMGQNILNSIDGEKKKGVRTADTISKHYQVHHEIQILKVI